TERQDPAAHNNYLELDEAEKLLQTLPSDGSLKSLRDRLLVSLMVLQGCRQIELHRLNFGDIIRRGDRVGIKVRAKRSIRVVPLRSDVAELLDLYLNGRKASGEILKPGSAMFISFSPNAVSLSENRLRRGSMQRIVNNYLEAAALKHCESRTVTSHGLRHTVGYLLQSAGKPLREIQEALGHADPRTTAIYAHIVNLWQNNPFYGISISV
ncbi:MAG: tyrosine-type recombinase/integrase, partial [Prochloraceae cyanobacterium]|nr:tyrosine-type recombinase/integrase [Prochloraceae cyanobacterium]